MSKPRGIKPWTKRDRTIQQIAEEANRRLGRERSVVTPYAVLNELMQPGPESHPVIAVIKQVIAQKISRLGSGKEKKAVAKRKTALSTRSMPKPKPGRRK